jgi:hypothetical protein
LLDLFAKVENHHIGKKVKCTTHKGTTIVKEEFLQVFYLIEGTTDLQVEQEDH